MKNYLSSETQTWNWCHSPQLAWISVQLLFFHFSPVSSPSSTTVDPEPSNEQPHRPARSLANSPNSFPTVNLLMKNSIPFSAVHPESEDEPLRSTNTSRQNVLSFASCPRHSNSQNHANSVAQYKQHRREHFASRARIVKQHRFNRHLPYKLKPEFSSWEISYWDSTRQEFTVRNSSPPSQRVVVPLRAITTHQLRSHWTRLRQLAVRRNTINFNF